MVDFQKQSSETDESGQVYTGTPSSDPHKRDSLTQGRIGTLDPKHTTAEHPTPSLDTPFVGRQKCYNSAYKLVDSYRTGESELDIDVVRNWLSTRYQKMVQEKGAVYAVWSISYSYAPPGQLPALVEQGTRGTEPAAPGVVAPGSWSPAEQAAGAGEFQAAGLEGAGLEGAGIAMLLIGAGILLFIAMAAGKSKG